MSISDRKRVYLVGGPERWLSWAKKTLSNCGYSIADIPQNANLVLVDGCNEECLKRIPMPIRERTVVLCNFPSNSFARWVLESGFKDLAAPKPQCKDKLEEVVSKALNKTGHLV